MSIEEVLLQGLFSNKKRRTTDFNYGAGRAGQINGTFGYSGIPVQERGERAVGQVNTNLRHSVQLGKKGEPDETTRRSL